MKPERWQQINKLFQAALALDPAHRASFLDHACRDDAALRREIESLIISHDSADSFIESPAVENAAPLLNNRKSKSVLNHQIGPYRIVSQLGAGGMGEVYLAEDARLGRKVALKLLPDYFMKHDDRVSRFRQEARAASALNHPNIITIHEIGETDGRHYIATEFVEGETLRQRMTSRRMSLRAALDAAVQVTGALAAAHQAGIVHRDVRPENIMLRPDGYVKVLDFGLAKLTEQPSGVETQAPTAVKVDTNPGTVMGTAHYMSPEQARGIRVDARTDIFSLGVVLYEMIAGRVPFEGETASDVIAATLKTAPPPLLQHAPEAPAELQRIVSKALRKEAGERYQTIKDLLVDLKSLKQEIEFEAREERSSLPETSAEVSTATGMQGGVVTGNNLAVQTAGEAAAQTTSSAEIILSEIKRHKRTAIVILAIVVMTVAGAAYGLYRLLGQKQSPAPSRTLKISQLTNHGKTLKAAISPDGKYLACVLGSGAEGSIWLRLVDDPTSAIQIVPKVDSVSASATQLDFSPDGKSVYYEFRKAGEQFGVYQVPVLGGTPKKVIDNGGALTISPDGKRIAFRRSLNNDEAALMIANADGTGEQTLATYKRPRSIFPHAWSPDGKTIGCGSSTFDGISLSSKLVEIQVADGSEKEISPMSFSFINAGAWLSDGSGLVIIASEQGADPNQRQIWQISYPGGEARKLTSDLNSYYGVSLTADSRQLVTTQSEAAFNIFLWPHEDSSSAVPITSGKHNYASLSWTPDGRLVYQNFDAGDRGVWIREPGGTKQIKLISDGGQPSVSPDGRYIFFAARGIWRMDIDGSNQKQLTGLDGLQPQCSPDGKWVVFTVGNVENALQPFLWKIPVDGGEPFRMTDKQVLAPVISPDGKLIACNYREQANGPWKIALLSFEDGSPVKAFDVTSNVGRRIHWSPDGRALTYTDDQAGVTNIWSLAIDGGRPKRLTNFTDGQGRSFAWSRDGKQLAISRGTFVNDAVLITNFR